MTEDEEFLPISALSHLIYCERRAALVHVLGLWGDNEHTTAGDLAHARVDSGEQTSRPGLTTLRSVYVRSERLRLAGVVDLVEVRAGGVFLPVETKRGARRRWASDEVQLCAQAMALEEMTGAVISEGAIFYVKTRRRLAVTLDDALRQQTRTAAARLHTIIANNEVPPPRAGPRCPPCSLRSVCQPAAALPTGSLEQRLREALR